MSVASEATESKLTIRRLHPALGAEVRGLDLGRPLDAASFEALRAAWAEHLVLVFPGQAIDDAAQIAFSRRFGELEVHHQTIIRSARAPEIFRVANVDEEGQLMAPEHPSVAQIKLAQRWHTDSSFRAIPSTGAILHGLEVVASGGETCFSREVAIGGQDMTQAVARRLGIEPFEAEAIKRASESHEAEVNTAIAPVLEDLVSELSLSLDYVEHHSGVRVDEILLSGGGALAPGAAGYIEQATARRARAWNPLEGLRVDASRVDVEELEAWASTLVVAVGLATRARTL